VYLNQACDDAGFSSVPRSVCGAYRYPHRQYTYEEIKVNKYFLYCHNIFYFEASILALPSNLPYLPAYTTILNSFPT
jgi:hypothetical protein